MHSLTQHSVSTKSAAYFAVKEMGFRVMLSGEEQVKIVRLYEDGDMKTKSIASRFSVSGATVRNVFRSHGVTPCKRNLAKDWYQRYSTAEAVDTFKASLVAEEER